MSHTVLIKTPHVDVQIAELADILPLIWSRESSGHPEGWTPKMPSYMQCHPTTRLFKALFGGILIYQTLKPSLVLPGEPKFWGHCINEVNGKRYDLTSDQLACEAYSVARERVLLDREVNSFDAEWPGMQHVIATLFVAYEAKTGIQLAVQ